VPVRSKDSGKFRVRIEPNGQMVSADHTQAEIDMVRAFTAFGSTTPGWYTILEDYQLNPVHWLLAKHGLYEAILPEQRGLLCLDMAKHVLPLFENSPDTKPLERRMVRLSLRIAVPYAMGREDEISHDLIDAENAVYSLGTKVRGKRGALYSSYTSVDRTNVARYALTAASNALIYITSAPPLGVSRYEIEMVASSARDAAIELDDGKILVRDAVQQLGPRATAETLWQAQRLMAALDPAKICRSMP
jgi:hypothetical protein